MSYSVVLTRPPSRLLTMCLLDRGYFLREIDTRPGFREFTAPNGNTWLTLKGYVLHPSVTAVARYIASNKSVSYQFASLNGAAIPKTLELPPGSSSLESFLQTYAPLVVKPLDSHSSLGMTMNIRTADQLEAATRAAYAYSPRILVQQQFKGQEVRFTILHGKVVHCLLRETPQVVGDGKATVAELITRENEVRRNLNFNIVPYPQLDQTLISTDFLTSAKVPSDGEVVRLATSSMVAGGGIMREITDQVDDSYKAIAYKLAMAVNPEFIDVDMLVADFMVQATPDNYVFLEYNTSPSLRLYYDVRSGNKFDIVTQLADMIDEWIGIKHAS